MVEKIFFFPKYSIKKCLDASLKLPTMQERHPAQTKRHPGCLHFTCSRYNNHPHQIQAPLLGSPRTPPTPWRNDTRFSISVCAFVCLCIVWLCARVFVRFCMLVFVCIPYTHIPCIIRNRPSGIGNYGGGSGPTPAFCLHQVQTSDAILSFREDCGVCVCAELYAWHFASTSRTDKMHPFLTFTFAFAYTHIITF